MTAAETRLNGPNGSPTRTFARVSALFYLLATPLFALLDYALGANVRVTFLDGHPAMRGVYYALAILCGAIVYARPRLASIVGVVESGANIGLLIVGVYTAYLGMLDDAAGPGAISNPFTERAIINLVISAAWGYASYAAATRRLAREA
jgi:hypothetical protein